MSGRDDPHAHAAQAAHETQVSVQRRAREEDMGAIDRTKEAIGQAKEKKAWFERTRAGRTLQVMKERNAMILSGGIAYYSLTSLAAGVVIAITLSSFLLAGNDEWQDRFYSFLNEAVPGVVATGGEDGLITPDSIQPETINGVVGLVSFLVLFNTATRYLRGVRLGVRAMLGLTEASPAQGKIRDFIALFAIIILVVAGIVLQVLASRFATLLASFLSDGLASDWIIRGPAIAVGVLLDAAFVALAIVVLGGYRGPVGPLLWTLLLSALAIGVLRQGVNIMVESVSSNPVLGSVTAVFTIMIFVDFTARIMMGAAAWLGTHPDVAESIDDEPIAEMPTPARRAKGSVTTRRATGR
ncbi:YihY/virulence factor BrkB family protein [Demequina sp. NBRC 110051]|uniref:YihY/virulence factor BrkB family protein n=1 Tax=Demequina sp. NBRC 110051 TaxID=1570340 RepID=UPI0009FC2F30|nr:YhjD/YihY/BrkB family envelope integrity protein [Demequina sp. NBRC 110051]